MYKIKQIPEDFIVREKLDFKLDDNGRYSYFILWKKDYTTFSAVDFISKKLKINPKFINSAGLKDRHGITEQFISISNGPRKDFDFDNIKLSFKGRGNERFNIGSLDGNYFEITVRNLPADFDTSSIFDKYGIDKSGIKNNDSFYVPNYFDDQRFGRDGDNHEIGRMIIKRDFKSAVNSLIAKNETKIIESIEENPNDYIGALRKLSKKVLRFYLSAYQSYLWNLSVKDYINEFSDNDISANVNEFSANINVISVNANGFSTNEKLSKNELFPLVGFNIEIDDSLKEKILNKVLASESLSLRDLIIRQIPEISLDGSERRVYAKVEDFSLSELQDDELNSGKKKLKVSFYLGKGSYATNVIKFLFKNQI